MRNIMQLLGGVAVAGVVAAGSTAFTAAGLNNNQGATAIAGGAVSVSSIVGASLEALTITNDATAPNEYSAVNVTITDDNVAPIISGTVTVKITGTTSTAAPTGATAVACTHSGAGVWACAAGASKTWTAITAVAVNVSDGHI